MSNRVTRSLLFCTLVTIGVANAQPSANVSAPIATALAPGEYITEGGWGQLNIKRARNTLSFSIMTVGANVHTCDLEGQLRDGRATLDGTTSEKPCVISMVANAKGVDVQIVGEGSCRYYCGMRASFTGFYEKPPAQCKTDAVSKTRAAFKKHYDAKQFADARRMLEPLLTDCQKLLDWLESGRIRNDLAVTLHKLGDFAACRKVLDPLATDAEGSDDDIRSHFPPSDADNYLPIVRSTRTNLKLCQVTR